MKKIYITILSLFLFTSLKAQTHQEMIVGNWQVDSALAIIESTFTEENVVMMQAASEVYSVEVFYGYFGILPPDTEAGWLALVDSTVYRHLTNDHLEIYALSFTDTLMTAYDGDEIIELSYTFETDTIVSVAPVGEEDFRFDEFEIIEISETQLSYIAVGPYGEGEITLTLHAHKVEELIMGCTDPEAENYNSAAFVEDGTCEYPYACESDELLLEMTDDFGDGWGGIELVINGELFTMNDGFSETACISAASCYMFSTVEGEWMEESSFEIYNENDELLYEGGLPFSLNDTDMVCDMEDNCLGTYNPDQVDTDNDGEGDECDFDDGLSVNELEGEQRTLVRIVNLFGQEYNQNRKDKILFYIYNTGEVEKVFVK